MTSEKIKNLFDINNNDLFFVISNKPCSGIVTEIKMLAKTSNINFFDLRLDQTVIEDIEGIRIVSRDHKEYFCTPSWWPTDMNSKGILLFDEIWAPIMMFLKRYVIYV